MIFDWSFKSVLRIRCCLNCVGSYLLENFKSSWTCLRHLSQLLVSKTVLQVLFLLEEEPVGIVVVVNLFKSAILVSEQTPFAVRAIQFLNKSGTGLWLILGVSWKILGYKFVFTMRELAFAWVSTDSDLYPVLAKFSLVLSPVGLLWWQCLVVLLGAVLLLLAIIEVLLVLGLSYRAFILVIMGLCHNSRLLVVVEWLGINNWWDLIGAWLVGLRLVIDEGNVEVAVLQLRGMREVELLGLYH